MKDSDRTATLRIGIIGGVMFLLALLLICKLGIEQLRRSTVYNERIRRQSVRRIRIPARRGKIFSSDLKVLAESKPGYALRIYPEEVRRPGRRSNTVSEIEKLNAAAAEAVGRPSAYDREKIIEHLNLRPGLPMEIFSDLSLREGARVLEKLGGSNALELEENELCRDNPYGGLAAHVLGYVGRESPSQSPDREDFFYYLPDLAGRAGMEKFGDGRLLSREGDPVRMLRGIPGCRVVQVDHLGFVRQTMLAETPPVHGNHLKLTIDSYAQQLGEALLKGRKGAFAAVEADTGAVLALASSPSFQLNEFYPVLKSSYFKELRSDLDAPLFNRALQGTYTPGSIVKPLIAAALLKKNVDPEEEVFCPGFARIGNTVLHCAARYGHGPVNMTGALEKSCNTYFAVMAMRYGVDALLPELAAGGLGRTTGAELPERRGLIPEKPGHRQKWTHFDTALLGIGQGKILVTPLQAANIAAAAANGGVLMKSHLLREVISPEGKVLWRTAPREASRLGLSPKQLAVIRNGMFQVVNSPEGSGRRAKSDDVVIFGKTGSAEVAVRGGGKTKNTWFIGFAELNGRPYAVALLLEEGSSGGIDCAPGVKYFFENYFKHLLTKAKK